MPILDSYSANLIRPKVDSCFIQDVTILDGALMAPSTRFTKIWRMRNNGSLQWPWGTKMVWIGGDKMGDVFSVDLQELDVAVDFIAPDRPGRYISYWRMRSPTGQKFGQRVWVLIQRLWFKTNLKLCKIWFDMGEYGRMSKVPNEKASLSSSIRERFNSFFDKKSKSHTLKARSQEPKEPRARSYKLWVSKSRIIFFVDRQTLPPTPATFAGGY